jgi:hypothetical protein
MVKCSILLALERFKPITDLRAGGHYCGKGRVASHYSTSQCKRRKAKR